MSASNDHNYGHVDQYDDDDDADTDHNDDCNFTA